MGIIATLKKQRRPEFPVIYKKVLSGATAFGISCNCIIENFVAADGYEDMKKIGNSFYSQILIAAAMLGAMMMVGLLVACMCTKQTRKLEHYITWIKCIVYAYFALLCVGVVWKIAMFFYNRATSSSILNVLKLVE